VALRKPSDFFRKEKEESNVLVVEPDETLREDLSKVENLSSQILQLQQELAQKVVKNDLETLILSQISEMREKFEFLKNDIKNSNNNDIAIFNTSLSEVVDIVNNLVENEIPKYKKQITKNEVYVGEKVNQIQETIDRNISDIREEVEVKFDEIAEVVDNNLDYFNQQLQESSFQVKKTTETYFNLSKILENKVLSENEKLKEYSQEIEKLQKTFTELHKNLTEEIDSHQESIKNNVEDRINSFISNVDEDVQNVFKKVNDIQNQVSSQISNIKSDVVIFEKHNKETTRIIEEFSNEISRITKLDNNINVIENNVEILQNEYELISNKSIETKKNLEVIEKYIQNHHQDIIDLKEEVFVEIERLFSGNFQENIERLEKKIDFIRETYSKIEPEIIVKEVIGEGVLNEPPDVKNSDPLTPLNQNFVTLDQLQGHYRLFLNRIQQQLATIGGGGETRLKYLDDIVGIATNASAYDGKFLKYNHSIGKFEFVTVSVSGDSAWSQTDGGIVVASNIGINTNNPSSALTVNGDASVSGIVTATDFNSASDINLKENISPIENPLDKVIKLEGVNFQWKESGKKSLGVIAQEVEKVLPELVSGEETKTVNYNGIIGLLIECVKKQQEEINELKRLIDK
jgi:chromosome segregation ATPase